MFRSTGFELVRRLSVVLERVGVVGDALAAAYCQWRSRLAARGRQDGVWTIDVQDDPFLPDSRVHLLAEAPLTFGRNANGFTRLTGHRGEAVNGVEVQRIAQEVLVRRTASCGACRSAVAADGALVCLRFTDAHGATLRVHPHDFCSRFDARVTGRA